MAKNSVLNQAKSAKQDEFYTRKEDIEDELYHYSKFFENKTVYMNCDDPEWSEFWQFFVRNLCPWKIKRLVATHYETNDKNYSYKLELEDTNGDGKIDAKDKTVITQIPCNGDFRSAYCIDLLKEADIVVTNPPFSLIREYISQLVEYKKDFLIMAPLNSVKYREVFPLIKSGYISLGYKSTGTDTLFHVPNDYAEYLVNNKKEGSGYKIIDGEVMGRANVIWLTNLDIEKKHYNLDLRGNYYKKKDFQYFDNYNAINVPKVSEIPCDFEGFMGVPISFLGSFNPDQFEILGRTGEIDWAASEKCSFFTPPSEEMIKKYKKQNKTWRVQNGYIVSDDGIAKTVYDRIFIKHKNPAERRYPDED